MWKLAAEPNGSCINSERWKCEMFVFIHYPSMGNILLFAPRSLKIVSWHRSLPLTLPLVFLCFCTDFRIPEIHFPSFSFVFSMDFGIWTIRDHISINTVYAEMACDKCYHVPVAMTWAVNSVISGWHGDWEDLFHIFIDCHLVRIHQSFNRWIHRQTW